MSSLERNNVQIGGKKANHSGEPDKKEPNKGPSKMSPSPNDHTEYHPYGGRVNYTQVAKEHYKDDEWSIAKILGTDKVEQTDQITFSSKKKGLKDQNMTMTMTLKSISKLENKLKTNDANCYYALYKATIDCMNP